MDRRASESAFANEMSETGNARLMSDKWNAAGIQAFRVVSKYSGGGGESVRTVVASHKCSIQEAVLALPNSTTMVVPKRYATRDRIGLDYNEGSLVFVPRRVTHPSHHLSFTSAFAQTGRLEGCASRKAEAEGLPSSYVCRMTDTWTISLPMKGPEPEHEDIH